MNALLGLAIFITISVVFGLIATLIEDGKV